MRKIIQRIADVKTNNFDSLERDVTEIQCTLAEKGIEYDNILVSVTTGIAYIWKETVK